MTLFLLRHEKRYSEPTFFTSLTTNGFRDSKLLINKIHTIQPDIIISSPFLRCIQTIYPYLNQYNKEINIDYALYEFLDNPIFTKKNYKHKYTELYKDFPEFKYIINNSYKPHTKVNQIQFPENTFKQLNKRLIPFINHLIQTYRDTDIKILLVSHMSVVSSIKHFILTGEEATQTFDFEMGHIESIIL